MTNEVSRDELMDCYSDLHKDVRGFRPMSHTMEWVETLVSPTTSRQDVLRWLADAGGNCYHGVYDWDQTLFENGVRHIPHQRKVKDWVGIEYSNEPAVFCAG